jgi:DNA primase
VALSNDKIEAIRSRVDIVQVIGAYVELRKQGHRYLGLCPFHGEKTPSFSVSPDKGLFYCFGCHAGGDAFAFLMKHEGLDFSAAAHKLAAQAGVELEPESREKLEQRKAEDELVRANSYALAFFQHALWSPAGQPGRAYLTQRGLPEVLMREWRVGFGGGPGEMLAYFDSKRVPRALAANAGLLTDDGQRSLFEGRVIFPVTDAMGRLVGFGGRRLGEGSSPKYVNTRESPLFAKRRLLFGWQHAEHEIRKTRRVIVVEGYMDVIGCHAAGLTQTVAALGTAFTDDHARQCARLAKEAVVLLDGDSAGRAAAFKVAERLLAAKLVTSVAALPDGFDPDTYWREKGADALVALAGGAKPAVEHFLDTAFADPSMSVEARAGAARELWPLILALGAGLEQDLYCARLAERVGVPVEQLMKALRSIPVPKRRSEEPRAVKSGAAEGARVGESSSSPPPPPELDTVELAMLRELLLYPELRPRFSALAEYAVSPLTRALLEELATSEQPVAEICARHAEADKRLARLGTVRPAAELEETAEKAERTYADVQRRMKVRHVDAARRDVLRELSETEARGEDTTELARRAQDLSRRKKALREPAHRPERS